jgi:hypothetical protein
MAASMFNSDKQDNNRVMQVFNEGRIHFREDGTQYFVGNPVMIKFKTLQELT